MSGFLLDSNVCISYLNEGQNKLKSKVVQHFGHIYLCDMIKMELYYGAYKSQRVEQNIAAFKDFFELTTTLPFDEEIAQLAGRIRADLTQRGEIIGAYDILIVSTAIVHEKTLVTHNTKEFQRVKGLKLVDWQ